MLNIKIIVSFIWLLLGVSYSSSQTVSFQKGITWNIQADVDALIPSGKTEVNVFNHASASRRQGILQKAHMALQQHPEILQELYELQDLNARGSRRSELFMKMGFTSKEFEDLEWALDSTDAATVTSLGSESIQITRNVDRVSFEAGEKLRFLNDLVIDPINNVVMIGKNVLSDRDTFTVSNTSNALKTRWQGYRWSYSHGMPKLGAGVERDNINAERYSVVLGRLDRDGRTYMEVSATEIRNGQTVVNYVVSFVINDSR